MNHDPETAADRLVKVRESLPEGADLRTERALIRLESVSIQIEALIARAEKMLSEQELKRRRDD